MGRGLSGWVAKVAWVFVAGCSLTHGPSDTVDEPRDRPRAGRGAAPEIAIEVDRSLCVTHWVTSGLSLSPELKKNSPEGPRSPLSLFPDRIGGDRAYVDQTWTDFTGDGIRDLAVRDWYPGGAAICEPVSVTVVAAGPGPVSEWPRASGASVGCDAPYYSLEPLGDWNGDGSDDLVAQGFVFVRGPDGAPIEDARRCRNGMRLGDVDGDGRNDSACDEGDAASGDLIAVASGDRDVPDSQLHLATADGSAGDGKLDFITAAGDLDADGYDDFFVHDHGEGHRLVFGANRAELGARVLFLDATPLLVAAAPGDVDGDGYDDLVLQSDTARLIRGQPGFSQETLAMGEALPVRGLDPVRPAGDANCDGLADVLIRDPSGFALHLGTRSGISERPAWTYDTFALEPVFANAPDAR